MEPASKNQTYTKPAARKNAITRFTISICIAMLLAAGWAWVGSGGQNNGRFDIFTLCGLAAFAINWIASIPAILARTETYYDITGTVAFLATTTTALILSDQLDARSTTAAALVSLWTIRLGTFLYHRIHQAGSDSRFDKIKQQPLRFFVAWTTQGLWVFITTGPALAIITSQTRKPLGAFAVGGLIIWFAGFAIEVIADRQKSTFKAKTVNTDRFISSGLWAWSRHPNYFGEIMLWTGIAIMAIPVLHAWSYLTLVSPLLIALLLTRISGIPMLESKANKTWGDDPLYQTYLANTPTLIPRPPKRSQ